MSYNFTPRRNTRPFNKYRSYHAAPAKRGNRKQYINPALFVKASKPEAEAAYQPAIDFQNLAIHPLIKANLLQKGINTPTAIQDQTIPHSLAGKDVVGIANTGTGKTVAFALPLLNKLMSEAHSRALIIAPTRELAEQIDGDCRSLAKGSGLTGALLIGGVAMGPQLRDLRQRPKIIIGTPGRIKDHAERGTLILNNYNIIVLDEVDRMLDMGFINDIRDILSQTNQNRQSYFFSATLDDRVKTLIEGFSNSPVHIMAKSGDTSDLVDQNIVSYSSKVDKIDKLHDLLIQNKVSKVLVFDDTHRSVDKLSLELQARGFNSDSIHGGKSQPKRQKALKRFRDNQINVLVATDVAARGIDIVDITHVINYSLPQSYGDYIHRIGRAGRAGRRGYALTFVEKS